jgi:hypothetical protein
MKPDEIFEIRKYDMVVAVTFEAINEQLKKLSETDAKYTT